MIRRAVVTAACALVALSIEAIAQATPIVSPDAIVYRDIERLAALGFIDSLIVGVRPFSEREVLRLLNEARRNLDRRPSARAWAEPAIAADIARYTRETQRPVDEVRVEAAAMESPSRLAPIDDLGVIDQDVNPLSSNRLGRPLASGATLLLESTHAATIGQYLALTLSPQLTATTVRGGASSTNLRLQRASANVLLGDLAIGVGRDAALFSQSPTGGVMLSANAPPLDMIRVWNEHAWNVPLLSRIFRGIRGQLVLADLGKDRIIYPHSKLIAYHVAALPHPQFEIGVQVLDVMGGDGGQEANFWDRVLDVIPIVDAVRTKGDFQFSNKLAGLDMRWRMPRWAGFELYGEMAADDVDGRTIGRSVKEDAAYLLGTSLSCLVECGRVGLRAEYHQTGTRYYMHTHYPLTKSGLVLGDQLGPRGLGGYLTLDADLRRAGTIAIAGALEARSGNTYRSASTGPNDAGFHFELVSRRPSEKRGRVLATWTSNARGTYAVQLGGGFERVANFAFTPSASRTNWLLRTGFELHPR
jgi:hypothetical protein